MFLAMSHHRLGDEKEARRWLTKAVRRLEAGEAIEMLGLKTRGDRLGWLSSVVVQQLRDEAETTLGWRVPPGKGR